MAKATSEKFLSLEKFIIPKIATILLFFFLTKKSILFLIELCCQLNNFLFKDKICFFFQLL
jgi:hypothetical protein